MSGLTKYLVVSNENPQVKTHNKDERAAYIVANHSGVTQEQATTIVNDNGLWGDNRLIPIIKEGLRVSSPTLNDQGIENLLDAMVGFWGENN